MKKNDTNINNTIIIDHNIVIDKDNTDKEYCSKNCKYFDDFGKPNLNDNFYNFGCNLYQYYSSYLDGFKPKRCVFCLNDFDKEDGI